ncbi:hypothetical protein H920_08538 [Fukomys damarensis]|uniref:Uncharacterized protein n=1 Tax=Fukomys damarensis TaxID=885580 RepID=A0A091DHP2_FUKDA|nr:hypothetical protein H920_08538 [Fukomys damarensis]
MPGESLSSSLLGCAAGGSAFFCPSPRPINTVTWIFGFSAACETEDLNPEGPKAWGRSQKICTGGVKELCHQAEGSTLEPGSDAHGEDQRSPDRTAAIPSDGEDLSSSSNENSQVHIKKTNHSKLLLANQQPMISPSSYPFMLLATVLSGSSMPKPH